MKKTTLILLALALLVCISFIVGILYQSRVAASKSYTSSDYQFYSGIDLSHHNNVTNWDQVNVDFVILKATEGSTFVDPKFSEYARKAKQHKILVGAYHFLTTSSSAEIQFKNFSSVAKKDKIDLIPIIDIERFTKGHKISRQQLRQHVRTFANLCEQYYGTKPMIYCSERFYRLYFNDGFEDCKYWCGDINRQPTIDCDLHQTCIKHIDGIDGKVDYNKGFIQLSELLLNQS